MFDTFLTIDELEANTRNQANDRRVTVTQLGVSRLGRPIEMISIGDGSREALVVGAPHPNEPAGAVTVERMIATLLNDAGARRGFRWHFIKAIDPEGLRLNAGWLKAPRRIGNYLDHFFRPALHRQPETTFPLHTPEFQFDRSTPENLAWQKAFALTRPCLHASLHHCDFGGVFYSISRALPAAIPGLEAIASATGFGVNSGAGGVMAVEQWSPAVTRYPSASELAAKAKASGDSWAYPWTIGEMSPGFGEANYGTFTIVPEVPMWHSASLHDEAPSGVSRAAQRNMLRQLVERTAGMARAYATLFAAHALPPDAQEFLWAMEGSLKMAPSGDENGKAASQDEDAILPRRDLDELYTHHALHVLRTQAYVLGLSRSVLAEHPNDALAREAEQVVSRSLQSEVEQIHACTSLVPVSVEMMTGFQMQAVFTCADALTA
jgi:hypothetical protein